MAVSSARGSISSRSCPRAPIGTKVPEICCRRYWPTPIQDLPPLPSTEVEKVHDTYALVVAKNGPENLDARRLPEVRRPRLPARRPDELALASSGDVRRC